MIDERWLPIAGYEGAYEVSDHGRVRNVRSGHILACCPNPTHGYAVVGLCRAKSAGGSRTFRVHRLVAAAFIPNPEGKSEVNHKDLNRLNNAASNLEWATKRENIDHAIAQGRYSPDVICPWQKITAADELVIRTDRSVPPKVWAEKFGVTIEHIRRVRSGHSRRARGTHKAFYQGEQQP